MRLNSLMKAVKPATILTALLVSNASLAASIYTDRLTWEAALGGADITLDPFDNDIPNPTGAATIVFDSGVSSAQSGGVGATIAGDNSVLNGSYQNFLDSSGGLGAVNSIWTFPQPVIAFAADWVSTDSGGGTGLEVSGDFDGSGIETVNFGSELGSFPGTGFLGIIGAATFTEITFGASFEFYFVDNLAFASPPGSVPEPGTLSLLGLGLTALGLRLRRLRRD